MQKRIRPGLDDKILCSWNSLMLMGFAEAGRMLARQDYIDIAIKKLSLFIVKCSPMDDLSIVTRLV